jgi:hypothetical protein
MLTKDRRVASPRIGAFPEDALGQSAVNGSPANRIVHTRLWHENAWL